MSEINRRFLLRWRNVVQEAKDTDVWLHAMHDARSSQASIPHAIFRVGDQFVSCVYLEDVDSWEVLKDGCETRFDTFEEAKDFAVGNLEHRNDVIETKQPGAA